MAVDFRGKLKQVVFIPPCKGDEFVVKYNALANSADKIPLASMPFDGGMLIFYEMNANAEKEQKIQETVKQEETKMRLKL